MARKRSHGLTVSPTELAKLHPRINSNDTPALAVFQPPKDEAESDRALRLQLANGFFISPAKSLYEETGNGAHVWAAYRAWRAIAGHEQLPAFIIDFLDGCAHRLEHAKTRDAVCRAVGMGAKAAATNRRGGSTRRTLEGQQRAARSLILAFNAELKRRAQLEGDAAEEGKPRPVFPDIYDHLAQQFKLARGTVENKISAARRKAKRHDK